MRRATIKSLALRRAGLGMALTVLIIFGTLAVWGVLTDPSAGSEKGPGPTKGTPEVGAVKSFGPLEIPHNEVKAVAEAAARHLNRGELTLALAPIDARNTFGRCEWGLNTGFLFPNDIDRPYVRHRVKREAAIADIQVAFGQHGDTTVFVTVNCL